MRVPAMAGLASLLAQASQACPVCFGASDQPDVYKAYVWGIVILLAFTMSILGGLACAMARIEASRRQLDGRPPERALAAAGRR